jgi:hypothetical protein
VKSSTTTLGDQFGLSVAVSDDASTLVVGAVREDSVEPDSGAVYSY